jgi:hypothetical protein
MANLIFASAVTAAITIWRRVAARKVLAAQELLDNDSQAFLVQVLLGSL